MILRSWSARMKAKEDALELISQLEREYETIFMEGIAERDIGKHAKQISNIKLKLIGLF